MTVQQALMAYLGANVGVPAYPAVLPSGVTLPALTYQLISTIPDHSQDGPVPLREQRIQLDLYAGHAGERDATGNTIRRALDGFQGAWGDLQVGACLLDGEGDGHEADTGLWRRTLDFMISYTEAPV